MPPFTIAGPMDVKLSWARLSRVPFKIYKFMSNFFKFKSQPQFTFTNYEGVGYMSRVVHTQPDGQHDVNARQRINCDVPEVQESNNVHQSQKDTDKDEKADPQICQ